MSSPSKSVVSREHGDTDSNDSDPCNFVVADVKDSVPTGTVQILDSPHVSQGPGRIANAPVPSVYVDDRGDIHRLRIGGQRLNLLYSRAHVMRSGYLHPHVLHAAVLRGAVEVWTLSEAGTEKTVYRARESVTVPAYVPHIWHFLEDSVTAEWWDDAEFQCFVYHPYRKLIDVQNSVNTTTAIGRHQRLVPQDIDAASKSSCSISTAWWVLVSASLTAVGLVAGIALGVTLGEQEHLGVSSRK